MPPHWKNTFFQYGRALLVVIVCTLARKALDPSLGVHSPLTTYFAGVMYVAWVSSWGPSLLTIVLSSLAGSYFFCEPRGSFYIHGLGHQMQAALFVAVGVYMTRLSNLLRRDIAQRKIVEAELRRSEEQVRHHQAELAHVARLSSMGELAAGLAHELNQPLYAVTNYARGCQRRFHKHGGADSEVEEALGKIADEAQRAAAIVQRLRNFVQKRQAQVNRETVSRLVEDAVAMSQSEVKRRQITVVTDISENLPPVWVDAIQIQQVLINLLRNAFEAMDQMPPSKRRVTIGARRFEDDAVEVAVSDCGPGISADNPSQIFEPFFTTKSDGMGMGLAICRTIVQAHGGRIWVESSDGKNGDNHNANNHSNGARGANFHFTLPTSNKE
jgi:two-component system sensor histidine kinase TtrS